MRYFEIIAEDQQPRSVRATSRFLKELTMMSEGYPETKDRLKAFLKFRETAQPTQGFNKKDYAYASGSPLQGFRHVHLIFGKVVLTYQLPTGLILLCTITDHTAIEGGRAQTLAGYLQKLAPADYTALVIPNEPAPAALGEETIAMIVEVLYEFASHPGDRALLDQTAAGKLAPDLWDLLTSLVEGDLDPEGKRKAILTAFGSAPAFIDKVKQILRQTAQV